MKHILKQSGKSTIVFQQVQSILEKVRFFPRHVQETRNKNRLAQFDRQAIKC